MPFKNFYNNEKQNIKIHMQQYEQHMKYVVSPVYLLGVPAYPCKVTGVSPSVSEQEAADALHRIKQKPNHNKNTGCCQVFFGLVQEHLK